MKFHCRGTFRVFTLCGRDVTPPFKKAQALLAILALSDKHERSRDWVMRVLWHDRGDTQAATSLRRALCDIRKFAPEYEDILRSDRRKIALIGEFNVLTGTDTGQVLLETPQLRGAPFDEWRSQMRFKFDGLLPQLPVPTCIHEQKDRYRIEILPAKTAEAAFLGKHAADMIATALSDYGDVSFQEGQSEKPKAENLTKIELESVLMQGEWLLSLRVFAGKNLYYVMSDRLRMLANLKDIFESYHLAQFINKVIGQLSRVRVEDSGGTAAQIHAAVSRIFSLRAGDLDLADRILAGVAHRDHSGLVQAWRSFAQLTRSIEYLDKSEDTKKNALKINHLIETRAPQNATVLALGANVNFLYSGDLDLGAWLADQAFSIDENNPYVLDAVAVKFLTTNRNDEATEFSRKAAALSKNMTHAHYWLVGQGINEILVGNLGAARDAFTRAYQSLPSYRPTLRYLVALNLGQRDKAQAQKYAQILQRYEPGFTFNALLDPAYPIDTLRQSGVIEDIERVLR